MRMHKVAVDTLNTLAKFENDEVAVEIGKVEDAVITMTVKRFITMRDFDRFVSEMKHSQFTDDNEFKPQFNSIVFDIALCEYYTNLNLPSEIEKAYEVVQRLDLKRKILNVIEHTEQYNDLINCINEAHRVIRAEKTGFNGLMGSLKSAIEDFNMKEVLETLKNFDLEKLEHLSEIKELASVFTSFQNPNSQDAGASSSAQAKQPANVVEFPIDKPVGGDV